MKKKIVAIMMAGAITLSPLLTVVGNAETLGSIQEKQNKVAAEKEAATQQINEIEKESSNLKKEIEELDKNISETKGNIERKESEIEHQKKEIEILKEEIQELNEQIEKRTEVLKDRMASYQQSGGSVSYLQVLLGSQNFSDFVGRLNAVNELMSADKTIMEQQESDLLLVEQKEREETEKQTQYEKQLKELKELEDSLNKQSEEKEEALKKLDSLKQTVNEELLQLENEERLLKEQELAIKKAAAESAQKAKEEEQRQAALKVKEQEESQAAKTQESIMNNDSAESTASISTDLFIRPASGPVTSEFGKRMLNGAPDNHPGIDIGKRGSNVPIIAAADGVVIRSDYSTSYGNVVYISHNLDGKIYTTVYAHMESLSVQSGQTVKQGQQLGTMGNTGISFGAHLHFEIHEGEWNAQKSNAVNPRTYINF